MKRVIYQNPRSSEYDEYLTTHITGVIRSWEELLKPAVLDMTNDIDAEIDVDVIDSIISKHDASKYSSAEYPAYCNYFYPSDGFEKDEVAFDLAWLHHQHHNPHHPQYWVLIRDEGEIVPMDMPIEYICEMLCDWHSFTLRDSKSTAYKWWTDNKDKMTLSANTVAIIEQLVPNLQTPLTSDK